MFLKNLIIWVRYYVLVKVTINKSYSRVVYDLVILEKLFYCGFQHLLVELKLQLVVSQEDMPNHFDVVCDRLIELLEFLDWSCYDLVLDQFCQIMHCCDES